MIFQLRKQVFNVRRHLFSFWGCQSLGAVFITSPPWAMDVCSEDSGIRWERRRKVKWLNHVMSFLKKKIIKWAWHSLIDLEGFRIPWPILSGSTNNLSLSSAPKIAREPEERWNSAASWASPPRCPAGSSDLAGLTLHLPRFLHVLLVLHCSMCTLLCVPHFLLHFPLLCWMLPATMWPEMRGGIRMSALAWCHAQGHRLQAQRSFSPTVLSWVSHFNTLYLSFLVYELEWFLSTW